MKRANWIVRDEDYYNFLPGAPTYGQVMLTSQNLVYAFALDSGADRDKIIKQAKRELINMLLADLLETEDWYEENPTSSS